MTAAFLLSNGEVMTGQDSLELGRGGGLLPWRFLLSLGRMGEAEVIRVLGH